MQPNYQTPSILREILKPLLKFLSVGIPLTLLPVFNMLPFTGSVPDPNPDPRDPHVFGSPGSGSTSQSLSSSKNSKKDLDSYCFGTSFGLFIFCHGSGTLFAETGINFGKKIISWR